MKQPAYHDFESIRNADFKSFDSKNKNKYLACYLRLSKDDENTGESNSIINQRDLIKEYIYSSEYFNGMQAVEFVDDGYSGTNFNRPGVKQLLAACKKGEINCIIVKDFSRFGRNYLEVSKYIEQIFPCLGIRFIAVNDCYDSETHKNTTAKIDVPVRNMINAMYSMDISKKVKSAKRTKIIQGVSASAYVIYGYKKDSVNRGKLFIDESAAVVVKTIFNLAFDGFKLVKIAEKLNKDCVLTPSAYKIKNGFKKNWNNVKSGKSIWTSSTVFNILKDERYTGTFIGGKREAGELGSKKYIHKPREEWVYIPDSHPAIVNREQFEKVSEMIGKNSMKRTKNICCRPLYKKVRCANCGHMLRYRESKNQPYYCCETVNYTEEYSCMRGNIREKDLNEVIVTMFLVQIKIFIDNEKILFMIKNKINKLNSSKDISGLRVQNKITDTHPRKRHLYERYKNGQINQILYLREFETLEKEFKNKTAELEALMFQQQSHNNALKMEQLFSHAFLKYQPETELTKEMVDKFIDEVNVYDSDRIEIKFKFKIF